MAESVSKKILIAEDSAVVQDILKLVLGQRGHEVHLGEDGVSTLDLLLKIEFDVALIDYRLPVMTGLDAARRFLAAREGRPVPRLLAMTGDTEAFLSNQDAADVFEMVLPKPIEIGQIVPILEADVSVPRVRDPVLPTERRNYDRRAHPYAHLRRAIIAYPGDFQGAVNNRTIATRVDLNGAPDALLITSPITPNEADALSRLRRWQSTPVIDLSGTLGPMADLGTKGEAPLDSEVLAVITRFAERRQRIAPDMLDAEDEEYQLLVRLHSVGGELVPHYHGGRREGVCYNSLADPASLQQLANRLHSQRHVERSFFDRLHHCPECASSRVSVREECPNCASSHLHESFYLHHFRCAYQGPEEEFRHDDKLVCPKCRYELRHFGHDYDKPGQMLSCQECGTAFSDAAVAFVCLDCGRRTPSGAMPTRDVFRYRLTDAGRQLLEFGSMNGARLGRALSFSDLPLDLVLQINHLARAYADGKAPFALMTLRYSNLRPLEWEHGEKLVEHSRELLMTRLNETLAERHLSGRGQLADYLLFPEGAPEQMRPKVQACLAKITPELALPLDVTVQAFGAEELY